VGNIAEINIEADVITSLSSFAKMNHFSQLSGGDTFGFPNDVSAILIQCI
jgi:hypothetical protein